MLSNLAPEPGNARWTVAIHNQPETAVFVVNQFTSKRQHAWTLVYMMGPFHCRRAAKMFRQIHWLNGIRRYERVLHRGVKLAHTLARHHQGFSLVLRPGLAEEHRQRLAKASTPLEMPRRYTHASHVKNNGNDPIDYLLRSITLHDIKERWIPVGMINEGGAAPFNPRDTANGTCNTPAE